MKANQTELAGVLLIEPTIHLDSRGRFFESYVKEKFHALGIQEDFVQDNQSLSQKNVLDRKSTRLNSSHALISYAVFCLKKKKTHKQTH